MQLTKQECKLVQRTLNEVLGVDLKVDGALGPASSKVICSYQEKKSLPVTGLVDDSTWSVMSQYIDSRFVTVAQVVAAAKAADLPAPMVLALWEVESIGEGFYNDKRMVVLFERHKFYQYAVARHNKAQAEAWRAKYPNLCHPTRDASAYFGGKAEWKRIGEASTLDATCTLLSTSWGLFQIMGFNYALAGYKDVQSMVDAFNVSEMAQLTGVINFVLSQPNMARAIRNRNHAELARLYNGAAYAANQYDVKLRNADLAWTKKLA